MRKNLINLNLIPISDGIWVVERLAARALPPLVHAPCLEILEAGIDQPWLAEKKPAGLNHSPNAGLSDTWLISSRNIEDEA